MELTARKGIKVSWPTPLRRPGYLALEQNDVPSARRYFLESLILNRETEDKPAVAACLASFAALAIRLDKPVLAAHLFGVVERQLESLAINLLFFLDRAELERIRNHLLAHLEEATLSAAFAEGWDLTDEQAIDLAREISVGED